MNIRKAKASDAEALKILYFEHLTRFPPQEKQDMALWMSKLSKFEKDENVLQQDICNYYEQMRGQSCEKEKFIMCNFIRSGCRYGRLCSWRTFE